MRPVGIGLAFIAGLVVACGGAEATSPPASVAPSVTAPVVPSGSIAPSASASSGAVPAGTPLPPGTVVTIEVPGTAYVRLDESPDNKIIPEGDALVVETVRGNYMSTRIGYDLPPGSFPPGTTFARIDMKICGSGSGDFWETYAPSGGEPLEQEVTQPAEDGCWHFDGAADGDPYFESFVTGGSKMRIEKIVYTITVG